MLNAKFHWKLNIGNWKFKDGLIWIPNQVWDDSIKPIGARYKSSRPESAGRAKLVPLQRPGLVVCHAIRI